ncbi:hypothetical protein [Ruminiclostridium josui]
MENSQKVLQRTKSLKTKIERFNNITTQWRIYLLLQNWDWKSRMKA